MRSAASTVRRTVFTARTGVWASDTRAYPTSSVSLGTVSGSHGSSGAGFCSISGRQVEDRDDELLARRAVDRRVVHLAERGDVAALEPVDQPDLPQRAGAVERDGDEMAGQLAQLLHACRAGHGDVAQVPVEVEVGVLDPDRVVQAERHLDEAAPERRREVEALLVEVAEPARS